MARADTFRSQGRGNRLCAWQEQPQVFGHEPRPDALRVIINHSRGSHFAWPKYWQCMAFLFARTLHLPANTRQLPGLECCQLPAGSVVVDKFHVSNFTAGGHQLILEDVHLEESVSVFHLLLKFTVQTPQDSSICVVILVCRSGHTSAPERVQMYRNTLWKHTSRPLHHPLLSLFG